MEQRTLKEEMRKIQLNKLQRNMAFMEDWNQKGIENWKKNQDVRKKNLKNDERFRKSIEERREHHMTAQHEVTRKEMLEEMQAFEGTLQKMGLATGEENEESIEPRAAAATVISGISTLQRIQQNKMLNDFLRKERDKRRRKMIVDQQKQHGELDRRELAVQAKLKQ